ncbi:MAG: hypothetical protein K0S00_4677 [Xanthobacteraceae bacterium]|jgi:hypothetical protein|nr:hypothetical protein [Xanthobacteraceae bacterium]
MPFDILVYGDRVRTRDTREECEAIAIKQGWGRIDDEGNFVLYPGNEIVEIEGPRAPPSLPQEVPSE